MSVISRSKPLVIAVLLAMVISPFLPTSIEDLGHAGGRLVAAEGTTIQEQEPNSDMPRAQEISSGTYVKGVIDKDADIEDWYKIFVQRGMVLNTTVFMEDEGLDADLEILYTSVAGKTDRLWSMTEYRNETVCLLAIMDQYYFIKVSIRDGTGRYTLDAFVKAASTLSDGARAEGALFNNSNHVIDYYKVWLDHRGTDTDLLEVHLAKTPIAPAEHAWINLRVGTLYEWSVGIRWYDISWGNESYEHARAAASESNWYYIMVNAYNGSGQYELEVEISSVQTDGNDGVSGPLLYGPGLKATGDLHQAMDHRDCYSVALRQGETLMATLDLGISLIDHPTIFSITILEPDGDPIGEWTNYLSGGLDDTITAMTGPAMHEGIYIMIVEAKVAVMEMWRPQDLSDEDGQGHYTLGIEPSGHNSPPEAAEHPVRLEAVEDRSMGIDLSMYFHDEDLSEGDLLSYGLAGLVAFDGTEDPLTASLNGTIATLVPKSDWSGIGTIDFVAWDLFSEKARLTVFFKVHPENDAPVALTGFLNFALGEDEESRPIDLDQVFEDPDLGYGDKITYSVEGNGTLPAWVDGKGELVIGPVLGMGQEEAFTVKATDLDGEHAAIQILVNVDDVGHAPRVAPHPEILSLEEDGASATLRLHDIFSDIDPEDQRLSFQWSGIQHTGALLDDDGILTIIPEPDWSGTEYITIRAIDHLGLSAKIEVAVKVRPTGDPPIIDGTDPLEGATLELDGEGFSTFVANVTDKDPDDAIGYHWYIDGWLIPDHKGRFLPLDEEAVANGTHTLTLKVIDGYDLADEASWTLVVKRAAPEPVVRGPTPVETSVSGGSALGLWLVLLVLLTEDGRFAIFKFLWVPLYTKIRKEEVLDQFIRGRIFGYIEHNPGVTYTQIKRKMGVGNGTLTHHLNMLERQNFVKAERDGIYKRFYPRDFSIDEDAIELSSVQKDIYFLAKTEPGISQKTVASKLGVSKRVISYHVQLLLDARLIKVERKGRRHALFVMDR